MNYQSKEILEKKFKKQNGWEVIEAVGEIEIYNQFWMIVVERISRYDDGCGYPYINLHYRLGDEGYPKYIMSFSKLKTCIEYIKQHGIV